MIRYLFTRYNTRELVSLISLREEGYVDQNEHATLDAPEITLPLKVQYRQRGVIYSMLRRKRDVAPDIIHLGKHPQAPPAPRPPPASAIAAPPGGRAAGSSPSPARKYQSAPCRWRTALRPPRPHRSTAEGWG